MAQNLPSVTNEFPKKAEWGEGAYLGISVVNSLVVSLE